MAKLIDTTVNGAFQLTGTGQMSGSFPFSGGGITVNQVIPSGLVHLVPSAVGNVPLYLEGYVGQTANMIVVADSNDNVNFNVDVNGNVTGTDFSGTSGLLTNISATEAQFGELPSGHIIDASGYLSAGSAVAQWDDLRVGLTTVGIATGAPGGGDPDYEKLFDNGAGSFGVYAWHFDDTTDESLQFSVQMPHGYMLSSDIKPHVHWVNPAGNTGSVAWGLEYTIAEVSGTFGNTTIISGSSSGDATADKQLVTALPDIVGTALTATSNVLLCRLFRDADNGSDDLTGDAAGISIDFHYQKDTLGSRQEFIK